MHANFSINSNSETDAVVDKRVAYIIPERLCDTWYVLGTSNGGSFIQLVLWLYLECDLLVF